MKRGNLFFNPNGNEIFLKSVSLKRLFKDKNHYPEIDINVLPQNALIIF
jgi:hypothetical protein